MSKLPLYLCAALCLALASSCSGERFKEAEGAFVPESYASVLIRTREYGLGTRAQGDESKIGETDGYDEVGNLSVYVEDAAGKVTSHSWAKADLIEVPDVGWRTPAFLTSYGTVKLYAVANNAGQIKTALDAATTAQQLSDALNSAYTLVGEDGFVLEDYASFDGEYIEHITMTGKSGAVQVQPGVSQADAAAGLENCFRFSVERIVSKVAVTKDPALFPPGGGGGDVIQASEVSLVNPVTGKPLARISNMRWTLLQYEKSGYPLPQSDAENERKSPSFSYLPQTVYPSEQKYSYALAQGSPYFLYDFTRSSDNEQNVQTIASLADMYQVYVTETTHKFGTALSTSGYRRGNTAFVLLTAFMSPEQESFASEDEYYAYSSWDENAQLWYSLEESLFYSAEPASYAADPSKWKKFTGGKIYWTVWLNPIGASGLSAAGAFSSPVLRNRIYHINVKKITGLGSPDPDPGDPDKPLQEEGNFISVEINVLPWVVGSYDIDFGGAGVPFEPELPPPPGPPVN